MNEHTHATPTSSCKFPRAITGGMLIDTRRNTHTCFDSFHFYSLKYGISKNHNILYILNHPLLQLWAFVLTGFHSLNAVSKLKIEQNLPAKIFRKTNKPKQGNEYIILYSFVLPYETSTLITLRASAVDTWWMRQASASSGIYIIRKIEGKTPPNRSQTVLSKKVEWKASENHGWMGLKSSWQKY